MSKNLELSVFRAQVRRFLADYIASEGCDCCRDTKAHEAAAAELAKLLRVQKYSNSSDYDFVHFRSKP